MASRPSYWNGRTFPKAAQRLILPSGRALEDAVVWPGFCQDELGLDPDKLWKELLAIPTWPIDKPIPFRKNGDKPHWITGKHKSLHMRGNPIPRAKIWCQSDYSAGLRRYYYAGWKFKIALATHAIEHVPPIRKIADRLNQGLVRSGQLPHNHWIVTRYKDQDDNIKPHPDQEKDFSKNSFFIVIKFGEPRPFAFQLPGHKRPFYNQALSAGTAVFVRCKGASAANWFVNHGVPKMKEDVGLSGSIVSRCITTVIPWDKVIKKAK